MPTAPFSNSTAASIAVVHLAVGQERLDERRDRGDLADQVAREVDDVRAEIAERARACLVGVEAPGVERRVVAPVLEVAAAEVADLAELARVDHLAREPHRRDEAVVERAQVLHAGRSDRLPDLVALVGVAPERLLADDVLARLRGGDRRLGVDGVRPAVVEQADRRVGDDVVPVGRPALVAVPLGGGSHGLLVPAGDRDQPRPERRRPGHVGDLPERVRVRLAHEGVPEHADADLRDVAGRGLAPLSPVSELTTAASPRRRPPQTGRSPSAARTRARPARRTHDPFPSPPTRSTAAPS